MQQWRRCGCGRSQTRVNKPENDDPSIVEPIELFAVTKTADQLDLQALHRVRERLVSQRTGIINQIRAFLLERGVAVRQGLRFLRAELPRILATPRRVVAPHGAGHLDWLKTGAGSMRGCHRVKPVRPNAVSPANTDKVKPSAPSRSLLVRMSVLPCLRIIVTEFACFSRRDRPPDLEIVVRSFRFASPERAFATREPFQPKRF
jgi:hypothetical protein